MNRIKGISAIWALPLLAGCSMDVGAGESADEPADTVSQAIFQAGCGTLPADKVIDARLLNVDNYQEGSDVRVTGATVAWGDAEPTTQAECERTWLGTMVYRKSGSSYVKVKENEARGVWVPPDNFPCPAGEICLESGNRCILPAVTYVSSVSDGQSYRFVGSARRLATPNGPADGSYFLRNVEFSARVTPLPPR